MAAQSLGDDFEQVRPAAAGRLDGRGRGVAHGDGVEAVNARRLHPVCGSPLVQLGLGGGDERQGDLLVGYDRGVPGHHDEAGVGHRHGRLRQADAFREIAEPEPPGMLPERLQDPLLGGRPTEILELLGVGARLPLDHRVEPQPAGACLNPSEDLRVFVGDRNGVGGNRKLERC